MAAALDRSFDVAGYPEVLAADDFALYSDGFADPGHHAAFRGVRRLHICPIRHVLSLCSGHGPGESRRLDARAEPGTSVYAHYCNHAFTFIGSVVLERQCPAP